MKRPLFTILILLVIILFSNAFTPAKNKWEMLFNGKDLDGWEVFVGPKEKDGEPLGLNNDPMEIFSVVDIEGEKVLRISGEINASIATKEEYKNYHLVMEYKWGEKLYTKFNSGLLYHSYGDFGAGLGVWMSSHEFQLFTGNVGDSYRMGDTWCEIPAVLNSDGKYEFTRGAKNIKSVPNTKSVIVGKDKDYENPRGEWNTIELYCHGGTSVHIVNGKVNMMNFNSAKFFDNGSSEPLTGGKIQLQSEGGEMFVRNMKIRPIKQIPGEVIE